MSVFFLVLLFVFSINLVEPGYNFLSAFVFLLLASPLGLEFCYWVILERRVTPVRRMRSRHLWCFQNGDNINRLYTCLSNVMSEYFLHFPEVFLFRNCCSYPVLTLAVLPVPQSSLMKFAESLQEMINYHTVHCSHCRRVKPDVFSFVRLLFPLYSRGTMELGRTDALQPLFNCHKVFIASGKGCSRPREGKWLCFFKWPSAGGVKMTEHL